jgi:hypothetical protein
MVFKVHWCNIDRTNTVATLKQDWNDVTCLESP